MLTTEPRTGNTKNLIHTAECRLCPDCRSVMSKVDQVAENGLLFIWYECTREGCDGQWLEKRTTKTGAA